MSLPTKLQVSRPKSLNKASFVPYDRRHSSKGIKPDIYTLVLIPRNRTAGTDLASRLMETSSNVQIHVIMDFVTTAPHHELVALPIEL